MAKELESSFPQVGILDRFRRVKRFPLFDAVPGKQPVRTGEIEYRKVDRMWQRAKIYDAEGAVADVFTTNK